jgi:hypothetical protein
MGPQAQLSPKASAPGVQAAICQDSGSVGVATCNSSGALASEASDLEQGSRGVQIVQGCNVREYGEIRQRGWASGEQ